ncbi:MAG: GGDEF domain-containing protein, partial [Pseudomonadota bacterium]|nr:GGDEF domain-containing protein [Pseudomonadota bacterium]
HDTVARLGGDEFAVLLENCNEADATCVAEKLRSAVMAFAFTWEGAEFRIGTSIGLVHFNSGNYTDDALIELADSMCYVAKDSGRDRVIIYNAADHPSLTPGHDVSHRPGSRRDEPPPL